MDPARLEGFEPDDPTLYREMLMTLLESINSSILLISADLRIVHANRNFLLRSRKARNEVVGRSLNDVLPSAITENTDITGAVSRVIGHMRPITGQRMTYRAPGIPMRIYFYSVLPLVRQRPFNMALLLMEDVTEQVRLGEEIRMVERHLAGVVESATDVILSTDPDGLILTWNTAAERLTNRPLAEIRGRSLLELAVPHKRDTLAGLFTRVKNGNVSITGEWDLLTGSGQATPISWVLSPMKDQHGKFAGVVAIGRDLTDQRKLEAQLLQSQKLAALGVMAGGIAHEIRNPLAICSSAAQFLESSDIDAAFREQCIEKILTGIQRASSIIENLLRFSRPSSDLKMARLGLMEVLSQAIELISNQAKIGKIAISLDLIERELVVYGNANLLQQMFVNLFLNALNSMPNGGRLSVRTEFKSGAAFVTIQDTGCGISKEDMANIFDPFFTVSHQGKGSGLGLSICYTIVKQHLGNIEAQSIVGEGSVFTVTLPIL